MLWWAASTQLLLSLVLFLCIFGSFWYKYNSSSWTQYNWKRKRKQTCYVFIANKLDGHVKATLTMLFVEIPTQSNLHSSHCSICFIIGFVYFIPHLHTYWNYTQLVLDCAWPLYHMQGLSHNKKIWNICHHCLFK